MSASSTPFTDQIQFNAKYPILCIFQEFYGLLGIYWIFSVEKGVLAGEQHSHFLAKRDVIIGLILILPFFKETN